jgi:hypothetical protein
MLVVGEGVQDGLDVLAACKRLAEVFSYGASVGEAILEVGVDLSSSGSGRAVESEITVFVIEVGRLVESVASTMGPSESSALLKTCLSRRRR